MLACTIFLSITFLSVNLTIEDFVSRPYLQASAFIVVTVLVLTIVRPREADTSYSLSGVIYVVFIVANCVMMFFVPRIWPYFLYSMLSSALYIVVVATVIEIYNRMASATGSGESGMIFLVIIYHPPAALLAIFLKWLYNLVF
jgi:hypothetical protein